MEQKKEYYAFISYKREDKKEAKWLQHALEYYRLPNQLRQHDSKLPEYVRPIFRDMTDLEVGELSAQIHSALEQSHYLIVVCSPRTAASKWVNDEIEYFISLGKQDKIIPYIIEGIPHASNPEEECYPPALLRLSKDKELLGANINEVGKDSATIRIVSRMFDIRFDTLYQRYKREQNRRNAAIVSFAIVSTMIALWIGWQNLIIEEKNDIIIEQNNTLLIGQSRYVAKEIEELILKGDNELATILAREILPSNLCNPKRPYTIEAERALRNSLNSGYIVKGFTQILVENIHEDMIYSAQYSDDGRHILTASQDGYVKIWDAVRSKEVFSEQFKEIKEAIFCPKQDKILLRFYNRIALYDIDSRRVEKEIMIPSCLCVCYNNQGTIIAAASRNKIIILDNNLNVVRHLHGHKMGIQSLDFSCDDRLLASASGSVFNSIDNTIKIWELAEGKNTKTLVGHSNEVTCVRFSPDNIHLVSASCDSTIIVWNLEEEKKEGQINGHTEFVNHVEYNPMGTELVSCSYDNTISIWDANTLKRMQTIKCDGWSDFVHYDKTGMSIVVGLWEKLATWKKQRENNIWWYDLDAGVEDVVHSADGKLIAIKTSNCVDVLDVEKREKINTIKLSNIKEYTPIQFHSDNKSVVCVTNDNNFEIISVYNPKERIQIKLDHYIEEFVVGKAGIIYAATYDDDSILLEGWDIDKGTNIFSIETGITTSINHLTLSENNIFLAASCGVLSDEENYIMLWNLDSMKCVHKFEGHVNGVLCSAFSKNGEKLLSVSQDHTLRCWDVNKGVELYKHRLHDMAHSVTTSYDGELFAASSQFGDIIIGQIKSGKLVETFSIGNNINSVLSFSSTSNCLSIGYERALCNKDFLPLNDLLNYANKIHRKLTYEEREKYNIQ